MAEKLDAYDFDGARLYKFGSQFDGLVDGGIYRIVVGEDVDFANTHSARQAFYRAARRCGKRGRIHQEDDAVLVVQAVPKEGE